MLFQQEMINLILILIVGTLLAIFIIVVVEAVSKWRKEYIMSKRPQLSESELMYFHTTGMTEEEVREYIKVKYLSRRGK